MDDPEAAYLPVEIWTQIYGLACTDDGSAGRALSLVSKDWRTLSAPYKLQSIALVGAKPILRFLCILESTPESLQNVQSLFIGCQNLRLYPSSYRFDPAYERTRNLVFTDTLFPELQMTAFTHTPLITQDAIEQSVLRILERVAPTLRALHTHLTFLTRSGPFYPVFLPHLEDLVLHGPFTSPPALSVVTPPSLFRLAQAASPVLPTLRCLRFAPPASSPHRRAALLASVDSAAPGLSHLRIPHTACTHADLKKALELPRFCNLSRLIVEMVAEYRSDSPPGNDDAEGLEHAALMRLAETDWRLSVVGAKRWWVDVQSALLEWEGDVAHWDDGEGVEPDGS
ncbi:hypothetical protein B0H10DRAFT_1997721 [Mycena sp. CBHHK59/15]|nr:hypothetical protein B0H10DRAFT_1997721 [Mycena sp. CBHHK59/15]